MDDIDGGLPLPILGNLGMVYCFRICYALKSDGHLETSFFFPSALPFW